MSSNLGNFLPPVSVQNAEVISNGNSSTLFTYLMGIYTMVYLGTLYLYLTRKTPQRAVIITVITVLHLLGVTQFAVQWFLSQYNLEQTLTGAEFPFMTLFNYPPWIHIVINVTSFSMFIVADGLLIWRCYHVWGRSYRIILLPLFLLVVEIGFSVSSIMVVLAVHLYPTGSQVNIINDLQSTAFFVSFATSLTTTVLIAYRIYSSAREMSDATFSASKGRFKHIVEIIVQSAALYSLVLLVAAISEVVPTTDVFPTLPEFSLATWSSCFLVPVAGIAPTIMVARVSLASKASEDHVTSRSPQSGNAVLSNLRFDRHSERSTNQNETRVDFRGIECDYGMDNPRHDERKDPLSV